MSSVPLLHSITISKRDGSAIYTAGDVGRDPALISGYVSAFSSMEREFAFLNHNKNGDEILSQFHRIGDVLLIIVGDRELITYGLFAEAPAARIDNLTNILSDIHKIFVEEAWNSISEEEKEIGFLPQEVLERFEDKLFSYFCTKRFRENIVLSPMFLNSEAGYIALSWFLNRIYSKISASLGESFFKALLLRLKALLRLEIDPTLVIRLDENVKLIKPSDAAAEDFTLTVGELIYETKNFMQESFGKNILQELSIFGGVKRVA